LQVLFRVWDIFLVDGADVLFRVAIAILSICEKELLECNSMPALYIALKSLPTRIWQADKLIQVIQSFYKENIYLNHTL
jgi:small G protein signaling modulator 3